MPPRKRNQPPTKPTSSMPITPSNLPTPCLASKSLRMSYRIARGEQGVLTFEPYKSLLLPHWRFRTVEIATSSSQTLREAFDHYVDSKDFVGADMSRKFIQMGMTRARRYANYAGGRKYSHLKQENDDDGDGEEGKKGGKVAEKVQKEKSTGHAGMEEKAKASEIFKEVWRRCIADERYLKLKKEFVEEQKRWDKEQKQKQKENGGDVKNGDGDDDGNDGSVKAEDDD